MVLAIHTILARLHLGKNFGHWGSLLPNMGLRATWSKDMSSEATVHVLRKKNRKLRRHPSPLFTYIITFWTLGLKKHRLTSNSPYNRR